VIATEINVMRAKLLSPRALRTPFTDAVTLTHRDERTYTDAGKGQRTGASSRWTWPSNRRESNARGGAARAG
jgi:hypothetical protein